MESAAMGERRANMAAAKCARIRVHSGDSFVFNDERDFHFLTLLSKEIQDDQVNVITEGLQLQKALASSLMVYNSDEGGEEKIYEGKLSPGSELPVADFAVGEEMIVDSDEADEDENSAGKLGVKIEMISDEFTAEEEGGRSFVETGLIPNRPATEHSATEEEENWSFVEKNSGFKSSKATDFDYTGEAKNYAAESTPGTAWIPDHSAAQDIENWSFVEKSRLTSLKITQSSADSTGKVMKNAAPKSPWPKSATPQGDDFENWEFMKESCELCTTEDTLRRLIRVPGCGHYFCNYCFEWYTSSSSTGQDPAKCLIKCPAETCFNIIEYDHCVAMKLQNSLDRARDDSISDWEFLDPHNLT